MDNGIIGSEMFYFNEYSVNVVPGMSDHMTFFTTCAKVGESGKNDVPYMQDKEVREHHGILMFCDFGKVYVTRASDFAKNYLREKGCVWAENPSKVPNIDHVAITRYVEELVKLYQKQGYNYEEIVKLLINNVNLRRMCAINGDSVLRDLVGGTYSVGSCLQTLSYNSQYFNNEKWKKTFEEMILPDIRNIMNGYSNDSNSLKF